jgi:restriction system protein
MARRRHAKKTTPIKELGFLLVIATGFFAIITQTSLDPANSATIFGVILVLALLGGVGFYVFLTHRQHTKQKALRALEISNVDEMSGVEFEKYVATLLRFQGYRTKMTAVSGDYGVDIVATKNGTKTAIQVKRYSSKLDQKSIREAVAGKSVRSYGCTEAMVITNSTFTKAAKFLASESGCELVDRKILGEWILEFQGAR